jgi:hypothetical protein
MFWRRRRYTWKVFASPPVGLDDELDRRVAALAHADTEAEWRLRIDFVGERMRELAALGVDIPPEPQFLAADRSRNAYADVRRLERFDWRTIRISLHRPADHWRNDDPPVRPPNRLLHRRRSN